MEDDDYDDWESDYYDFDRDDDPRLKCIECEILYFPEDGITACDKCEEFVCKDCKEFHVCK